MLRNLKNRLSGYIITSTLLVSGSSIHLSNAAEGSGDKLGDKSREEKLIKYTEFRSKAGWAASDQAHPVALAMFLDSGAVNYEKVVQVGLILKELQLLHTNNQLKAIDTLGLLNQFGDLLGELVDNAEKKTDKNTRRILTMRGQKPSKSTMPQSSTPEGISEAIVDQIIKSHDLSTQASVESLRKTRAQYAQFADTIGPSLTQRFLETYEINKTFEFLDEAVGSVRNSLGTIGNVKSDPNADKASEELAKKIKEAQRRVEEALAALQEEAKQTAETQVMTQGGAQASTPSQTLLPPAPSGTQIPSSLDLWKKISRRSLIVTKRPATPSTVVSATSSRESMAKSSPQSGLKTQAEKEGKTPQIKEDRKQSFAGTTGVNLEDLDVMKATFSAYLATVPQVHSKTKKPKTLEEKILKLSTSQKNELLLELATHLGINK